MYKITLDESEGIVSLSIQEHYNGPMSIIWLTENQLLMIKRDFALRDIGNRVSILAFIRDRR